MKEEYSMNLCELLKHIRARKVSIEDYISCCEKAIEDGRITRIYIGSYFCSHYFLHLTMDDIEEVILYAQLKEIQVTLVIPIVTEKNLGKVKQRIEALKRYFGTVIDEITVNDIGMLSFINTTCNVSINLGRLMMKDYRDPRYEEYFNQSFKPRVFTNYMRQVIKEYGIKYLEFDPTHTGLDFSEKPEDVGIALHSPYCYMTTGQICEYSSLEEEIPKKFRPNIECKIECLSHHIEYEIEEAKDKRFLRFGRTIYFENKDCAVTGLTQMRVIYFPLDNYIR